MAVTTTMMGPKTILLITYLFGLCMGSRPGWPDYELYSELQGWLKVHTEPVDWRTARTNCHNEGALLASPWTPQFTTTINRLQTTTYSSLPVLYSGAGLRTGSPGLPMEPCDSKRCPVFQATAATGKVNCGEKLPYVCYAPAPPESESCAHEGYEYKNETGHCYKLHHRAATEPAARKICISEGAYLALIDSKIEEKILESSIESVTFIDNGNGGPKYRHVFRNRYRDYACSGAHRFFCEMGPELKAKSIAADFRD